MKYVKFFGVILALTIAFAAVQASQTKEPEKMTLWGKQTKGWGNKNAEFDGNAITFEKTAKIIKVDGNAKSYCLWTGGKSVLCGGEGKDSIVGKTLEKGRYVVRPGLSKGQWKAEVTITLQYVE